MLKISIHLLTAFIICFLFNSLAIAKDPMNYKSDLMRFNVILSANDEDQVRDWLFDKNSGYPDLADKLLDILNHTKPKGETTVLDAIMGKYRIVKGKPTSEYIPPPYDKEDVKKAYIKNWKDRNKGAWDSFPAEVKQDEVKAFGYIRLVPRPFNVYNTAL